MKKLALILGLLFSCALWGQDNKDIQLRFDGIYATKPYNTSDTDSLYSLLRFYKDGTVISMLLKPINKNWTPDSLKAFNRERIERADIIYRPIGKYKIIDKELTFKIKTKMAKTKKYNGNIIDSETLEMTIISRYKKRTKSMHTFYFIPYKQ